MQANSAHTKPLEALFPWHVEADSDELVQERRNSSALAIELHLSCTNPSIQNGHCGDDILKCILNENFRIFIKISLNFIPKGPIDNKSPLVQIMAWCRWGDKPLSELMMA